jgi:phosphoglycolate phosphatase
METIKLVILDLDGTLIDSLDDLTEAINHMLGQYGSARLLPAEVRKLVGQGSRVLVEKVLALVGETDVEQGLHYFLSYSTAHIVDKTGLYPGVRATLDRLVAAGMQLAVLSNKNVALCHQVLEALEVDEYFAAVFGADSFPQRKPSPAPVLQLMDQLVVSAKRTVMVGDSINDIAAGRGAGVITIGCTYGYGVPAELAEADYRVGAFAELLELPVFKGR